MKHKNEILIISGNVVSQFGNNIFNLALNWWIISSTDNPKILGIVSAFACIPLLIFNIIGGVIVDKSNKKNILVFTDLLSAALCILLGFTINSNSVNIPLVIVINILLNTCHCLFSPALGSILPEVIGEKYITRTNSILTNLTETVKMLAPLVGGILFAMTFVGVKGVFIIDGITFLISAMAEVFIDYKQRENKSKGMVKDLLGGFNYIKSNSNLFALLLVCASVNFFIAGYNIMLPVYAKRIMANKYFYSFALTAEALGGIVGSFLLAFSKKSSVSLKQISNNILFCGMAFFITFYTNQYTILISIFLFGLFLTRFNIAFFSYLQLNVDGDFLGRVFSVVFFIALALMPIGNIVFGYLANYIINQAFFIVGLGITISAAILLVNKKQEHLEVNSETTIR